MREREFKLFVEPGVELPAPEELLDRLGDWAVEELEQEAVYFDTPDLRLTRAGVSLRYRSDDGWTVKLPEARDGSMFLRGEQTFAGERGAPPQPAAELVRAWARAAELGEVAHIRTQRRKIHVYDRDGCSVGEIDDDHVTASVPDSVRFREVEVEMGEDADPRLVDALVTRLEEAGAGTGVSMPKIARVLGERALEPPDLLRPGPLDHHATLEDLVQASIARSVERLVDNDPIVRIGEDPEGVHQARVATRRLRSDLRTFRPILDPRWSEPLRAELRWLGEHLGRVRDADVLLGLLASKSEELPADEHVMARGLIARLRGARARDRDVLLDALRSPRYAALLDRLVDAARAPRMRDPERTTPVARAVGKLARRPWKQLRKKVRQLPVVPTDADLHEVRMRAKQARYALEAISPVAGRQARRAAKRVADLQGVLGDHHDAVVATGWLHEAARESDGTELAFVAGKIAGSFAADQRRLRSEWRKTWKRADRLHGLTHG